MIIHSSNQYASHTKGKPGSILDSSGIHKWAKHRKIPCQQSSLENRLSEKQVISNKLMSKLCIMLEGDKLEGYKNKDGINRDYLECVMGKDELQINMMVNLLNIINYNGN